MRRIRKIVLFTCTTCYSVFPSSKLAKEHARTHPAPPKETRQRETQTGAILDAIRDGATTAAEVSQKTKIPLERVHSLLSYHRRRGNVRGFNGKLRAAKAA
jgi:predicted Rossmann fold nucleotide-binding protein DprA/Smf involved in DNA uptake